MYSIRGPSDRQENRVENTVSNFSWFLFRVPTGSTPKCFVLCDECLQHSFVKGVQRGVNYVDGVDDPGSVLAESMLVK